jgi:hypothetical protein
MKENDKKIRTASQYLTAKHSCVAITIQTFFFPSFLKSYFEQREVTLSFPEGCVNTIISS